MPSEMDIALRLLAAAALGAAIGAEREFADQPAGFRTHMLVGVGSALFAVVSAFGFQAIVQDGGGTLSRVDPSRVAAQIVVGVGFLGGGAIIKSGGSIRGLTTAASLWVTAAIGTACGIGMLLMALVTGVISILALAVLKPLRSYLRRRQRVQEGEFIVQAEPTVHLDSLVEAFRLADVQLTGLRVTCEDDLTTITAQASIQPSARAEDVLSRIHGQDHVVDISWSVG